MNLGPEQLPTPWEDVQIVWNAFEPYVLLALALWVVCLLRVLFHDFLAWRRRRKDEQFTAWLSSRVKAAQRRA